jgi:hypothetical protein
MVRIFSGELITNAPRGTYAEGPAMAGPFRTAEVVERLLPSEK